MNGVQLHKTTLINKKGSTFYRNIYSILQYTHSIDFDVRFHFDQQNQGGSLSPCHLFAITLINSGNFLAKIEASYAKEIPAGSILYKEF